tara:strand:+ start:434 stop:1288 length:855 start_codon:yes stop_codon:yes gene_type:complete
MHSNNILEAIRDKRLILTLYDRIQSFQVNIKKEYKDYLKRKNIRELLTLSLLFVLFFCSFFAFSIKDFSTSLIIIYCTIILIFSFFAAFFFNIGLSKLITFIYNKKIINEYNIKFNSLNKDRLGIDLVKNPLFYSKLDKMEKQLEKEEQYYINNFNFFSNKRTEEGLLLNIYLKAIRASNFELLEDNFEYISSEIKQTFRKEEEEILIGIIKNIISENKKTISNKELSEEVEENIEVDNMEEINKEQEDLKEDKEKTEEEIREEEERKFLESLDIDDLIPQQKF